MFLFCLFCVEKDLNHMRQGETRQDMALYAFYQTEIETLMPFLIYRYRPNQNSK